MLSIICVTEMLWIKFYKYLSGASADTDTFSFIPVSKLGLSENESAWETFI
jgi:hypothetical protein